MWAHFDRVASHALDELEEAFLRRFSRPMSRCHAGCPVTMFELKDPSSCSIRSVFSINLDTERKSLTDDAVANALLSELPGLMCQPITKPSGENVPDVVDPVYAVKSDVGDTVHFWKARTVLQALVFRFWEDTGLFSLVGKEDTANELNGLKMLTLEVDKWRSNDFLLRAVPHREFSLPDLIGITYSLMTSIGNSLYPWLFTPTRCQARVHDAFFLNLLLIFRRFSFAVLPDEFLTNLMTVLASTNENANAADIVATPVAIRAEISSIIAGLDSTMQVLDQTCGTGSLLCDIRQQCPNVFGIDIAPFAALATEVRLLLGTSRQHLRDRTRVASTGFECEPVLCANTLHLLSWVDSFKRPYLEAPFEELSPENRSAIRSELCALGVGGGGRFACVISMPPISETSSAQTSNFVTSSTVIPLPCKRMPLYEYFLLPPMKLLAPNGVLITVLPLSFFQPTVSQIWRKFFEGMRLQRVVVCTNADLNGPRDRSCIVVARKRCSGGPSTGCSYNVELCRAAEAVNTVGFNTQKPTQLWSKLCELAERRQRIVEGETARANVCFEVVEGTTFVGQVLQRIVDQMQSDNSELMLSCTFRNLQRDRVDCLALDPNKRVLGLVAASQNEPEFKVRTAPSKKQKLHQDA